MDIASGRPHSPNDTRCFGRFRGRLALRPREEGLFKLEHLRSHTLQALFLCVVLLLIVIRTQIQQRFDSAMRLSPFLGCLIEVVKHLEILFLSQRVEFVIVAAAAIVRQPHPDRPDCFNPIKHILDPCFLRYASAFPRCTCDCG